MKKFTPLDDDLCRIAANVIVKMRGCDMEYALDCARTNMRNRRKRRECDEEQKDKAAKRIWMRMAGGQ